MPNAIICSMPGEGHVRPLLVVARELLARGWQVRMLTGARYRTLVEESGAHFVALPAEADTLDAIGADGARERGRAAINRGVETAFIAPAPSAGRRLLAMLDEAPADVVLHEPTFLGVQALHRLSAERRPAVVMCGIIPLGLSSVDTPPFGLGLAPLPRPWANRARNRVLGAAATRVVLRPAHRAADRFLAEVGAPPLRGRFFMDLLDSADLIAQFTVPEFEFPRSDAPERLRFYGPMAQPDRRDVDLPPWWDRLDRRRPLVHVTQGTVANVDLDELVRPTLEALADEDVTVVVTTGGRPVEDLGEVPANALVGQFLPYDRLLPRVDVLVTNGGYGGLHHALRHGVPIVVAGDSEDKVETSARVAWSGAGISLRTGRPRPAQVGDAVRRVLGDPRFAERARRIGASIAAASGPGGFVRDVEALVAGRHAAGDRASTSWLFTGDLQDPAPPTAFVTEDGPTSPTSPRNRP
ncbi:glycosyltransferase [Nocardioides zeae]|uniref:Glycosyltransferase n=1 Tax=Nocardioides imazamoxiresistens TaxID=3231893 RepID=A0ABU3PWD6_9ACTN|nr:nucleotide disphospho-sugar-binding domain-containing protein [Nocardioides zeae]MDT9593546.1 glycosyltransferase [Nocardioides zeae]